MGALGAPQIPAATSPPIPPALRGQQSPLAAITAQTLSSKDLAVSKLTKLADDARSLYGILKDSHPSSVPLLQKALEALSMALSEVEGDKTNAGAPMTSLPGPTEPMPPPTTSASPVEGAYPA